jgi:DNA polymerase III alpha subunit
MVIDDYGIVGYSQDELVEGIKENAHLDISDLFVTDGSNYINARQITNLDNMPIIHQWEDKKCEISPLEFHTQLQNMWLMPENYKNFDIEHYLINKCKTEIEINRVKKELLLYNKFNLINLLKYLKYLKDIADKNNIVWGVGRGSSCASYCLYLLKIHRVDSIKYNLNINEFLHE